MIAVILFAGTAGSAVQQVAFPLSCPSGQPRYVRNTTRNPRTSVLNGWVCSVVSRLAGLLRNAPRLLLKQRHNQFLQRPFLSSVVQEVEAGVGTLDVLVHCFVKVFRMASKASERSACKLHGPKQCAAVECGKRLKPQLNLVKLDGDCFVIHGGALFRRKKDRSCPWTRECLCVRLQPETPARALPGRRACCVLCDSR